MKTFHFAFILILISKVLLSQSLDLPFTETGIALKTSSGDILGTITTPNNSKKFPIVVIIPGSGPTDRNCNSTLGMQTNAYRLLAEEFAKQSIATLRYDKRGIGESKPALSNQKNLRFETYINDVIDWVSLLKMDKRFSKIILLGHSEGSLIGMIAAEKTNVGGFISISGAGKSADKILQQQLKTKLPPKLLIESNKILDSLKVGRTVKNVSPSLASIYHPGIQPYMISWMKYDPAKEISKLKIPVLIIQGTTDLQVSEEDARLLSASKPDAKLLIIENMNHVLKESDSNIQNNLSTYKKPELPLKSGLVDEIIKYL